MYAAQRCPLTTMVRVAGTRWCIESGFEAAKGEVGSDEYEVRNAAGWYRQFTLALWALALLAVIRATTLPAASPAKKAHRQLGGLQTVPRGWGRPEPGRDPARAVPAYRPRRAPRPGLAGLDAAPRLGGPVLLLPATHTTNCFTTVVLSTIQAVNRLLSAVSQ